VDGAKSSGKRNRQPRKMTYSCQLISSSNAAHLQQLYTGFAALNRSNYLNLRWTPPAACGEPDPGQHALIAVLNDGLRVAYDVIDAHEIDRDLLARVDLYFKRSCAFHYPELAPREAAKIRPLGLNYEVYPDDIDLSGINRTWRTRHGLGRVTGIFGSLGITARYVPRQRALEPRASDRTDPFVVFLTRVWDPDDVDRDNAFKQDRLELNSMRAACIRALREHFGGRAIVGLLPSNYASRTYPELQVHDPRLTDRGQYQDLIRRACVCVTSTGLHRSAGWKLGEYVSLGKAIVSEKVNCTLPGEFLPEHNYLSFSDPDQCVAAVTRLFTEPDLIAKLMTANTDYYQRFLKPDMLIMNSLGYDHVELPNTAEAT